MTLLAKNPQGPIVDSSISDLDGVWAHDPERGSCPYPPGTALNGLVIFALVLDELLDLNDHVQMPELRFYPVVPLTVEEMDFKLTLGLDALLERLDKGEVRELVDTRAWLHLHTSLGGGGSNVRSSN
ncbi:suppressor of fused domain protein [Deinococcus deserti]|uniref:Suppressor of fused-like domain-containing protein n=1 Tax=Deinococcus deserti (strain DSM 17065 / CIP 109153 / LMG 22923 / VCD115) TaxID=546414 RepID=C1D234_DEIDV|nr:suppressor of fused domain protein [Deinococcus deserti]ACO47473.1 Hypothetical protein Deide_1p00690 [Deinococcus deserti VCD115]